MLYTSIKQAENGLFFLLFESEVINMFVRRSRSEWRRANSWNVSLDTLYGGQFTLSTQFIKPNYLDILPLLTQHRSSSRNVSPSFICLE